MSKLQQYLVLGGILFLFQTKFVRGIFQSSSLLYVILGIIGVLLVTAVVLSIIIERRKKIRKANEKNRILRL